jgi:coenzyme F420-reducing hydrogenase delta subunit/Pyruvate/2-oxoacid:ferredoxin oxidoreductase delta subunit
MSILRPLEIIISHGPELAAAGLDPHNFSLAVAGFPKCRVLLLDPALPEAEQEERLRQFLGKGHRRPLVLAGMDPERRAAVTLRLLRQKFRFNPERLAIVDLQAALEQPDKKSRRLKGLELIRLAAAHVTRTFPILSQDLPVSTQVLVWGDSFAALKAAQDLAASGYPVILASPHASLEPLDPEGAHLKEPSAGLASLIREVQAAANIRVITEACILGVAGVAGNFLVRLGLPQEICEETVGAVILTPELELIADPEIRGFPAHPRLVSQTDLELLLESGELAKLIPEEEGGVIVLLAGFAAQSGPPALRRALAAASRLLSQENLRIYLVLGHARVAAPGLEAALEASQDAGLIVFKLTEQPEIIPAGEKLQVSFMEPILRRPLKLAADIVVYEEDYRAAPANAHLAELLEIPLAPGGFLQGDNVHQLPVATLRRGIYVAGPGRGVMGLDQALMDVEAAVVETQKLLGQGSASALQGRAVLDRGRCVLCLTCYRVCPHRAIGYDNRAVIEEIACQGCGLCASECPQEAIQIRNYTDDQLVALFESFDPQLSPRIVAFLCQHSAWEAYQAALKLKHADLPLGFTAIKMPCAGKIDADYLLKAVVYGARGVMVLACHPDNCKSHQGNEYARWRVEQVQSLLADVGLEPHRVLFKTLAANAPQDFLTAVAEMQARLEESTGVGNKVASW